MADNALTSLRTRAQAVARLYFAVLWPDAGAPDISSSELAKFKRAAVRTGREYLAASTGWDPDQILYDPMVKNAYTPLDPETPPPFFPDEVYFGLRAIEKEPEFWKDKLASADHVVPHDGPGVIALEGEAGVVSRYVFAPPAESFLASFHAADSALASPLGQPATFVPIGYDTSVLLTDRLVYVVPASRPAEVGRMSYSDLLAVSEERRVIRTSAAAKPARFRPGATGSAVLPQTTTESFVRGGLTHGASIITETTIPRRDTTVYRLRRNAPFADSPALYELDRPGETVHLLGTPTAGSASRHAPHRIGIVPLKSAVVSRLEDAPIEESTSEPVTVFVATPRAVLVTRTHGPASVRVMDRVLPKPAATSDKAPPLLLASTAAITAGPLARKVTQAVQAALAKPSAAKVLQAAPRGAALHTVAEARWKMPITVLPKTAVALTPRPVEIGPKVFLSELHLPESAELRALPAMKLVKPRFLQALSLGHVEVSRFREVELPMKSDLTEVKQRLKQTTEIVGRAARAKEKPGAESIYLIRTAGPVERMGGYELQRFSVVRSPRLETSLLDLEEFQFIKPPERKQEKPERSLAKLSKPQREAPAPAELNAGRFADQIIAAVVKAVGPAYGKSIALAGPGEAPAMPLAAASAASGADRKRELAGLLEPVAAFFKPVFAKSRPEPKVEVAGGAMAAPGLFDVGGGSLVAVLPRETGRKRSVITEAAAEPFAPAEMLTLLPTSVGWMFGASRRQESRFREVARASGLVVKPLSRDEAEVVAPKAHRQAEWDVDEAELVSASSIKSRETEQLWRALTKEAEMAESKAYTSLAGRAEPPVRKQRKAQTQPATPEPAERREIKKVSSDPLHDFDETVLDEIMFALKRRMESETEGRGGYE